MYVHELSYAEGHVLIILVAVLKKNLVDVMIGVLSSWLELRFHQLRKCIYIACKLLLTPRFSESDAWSRNLAIFTAPRIYSFSVPR